MSNPTIDLQPFCCDDARTYFPRPWHHAGRIYATNGNVIVRIPDDGRLVAAYCDVPDVLLHRAAGLFAEWPADGWFRIASGLPRRNAIDQRVDIGGMAISMAVARNVLSLPGALVYPQPASRPIPRVLVRGDEYEAVIAGRTDTCEHKAELVPVERA